MSDGINLSMGTTDALSYLISLRDQSIDAVITDPPYGTTQHGWDVTQDWPTLWSEIRRVLRPGGNVVVFSAQPFTTDLILSNRDWYRYEIVWRKTTPTRHLDANRRPLQIHETIQVFGPSRGFYCPQKVFVGYRGKNATRKSVSGIYGSDKPTVYKDDGWRHPTTVLEYAKPPRVGNRHPSEKPVDLMRWLVRSFCPSGGTVLDPFMGSGSTGEAALAEGRRFFGTEIDPVWGANATARLLAYSSITGMLSSDDGRAQEA